MGKRGNERPYVVGTRLSAAEKAELDRKRGPIPTAVWLRHLIRHADSTEKEE